MPVVDTSLNNIRGNTITWYHAVQLSSWVGVDAAAVALDDRILLHKWPLGHVDIPLLHAVLLEAD